MRSVETAGMTADPGEDPRGGANLYSLSFHRTAGGSCVCSRKMKYGGISYYTILYRCSVKKIRNNLKFFADNHIIDKKDMEGDYHAKEIQRRKLQRL